MKAQRRARARARHPTADVLNHCHVVQYHSESKQSHVLFSLMAGI